MSANPQLHLAFVLHAHQPVSNSDEVFDQVLHTAYLPVLRKLAEFPTFHCTLHFSGSLLDRLERRAPETIKLIRGMLKTGQIELLGGGYHEPLLPFIPAVDRRDQILALKRRLRKVFDVDPQGIWLAERFWEPVLANDLASAGVGYTLVDEHAFLLSGFTESQMSSHFVTEDQGNSLALFPISKTLRYLIPYAPKDQLGAVLFERAARLPGSLWTFADDLEKFGAWPGTWESVHEKGWLSEFLSMISANPAVFVPLTLSEALKRLPSAGLAYLPTASYPELMRWALPPALRGEGTRTGNPRHFLVRYPEINILHKRMIMASQAVHAGTKPSAQHLELLWQSQTGCAYWHGWFGGSYFPHLRQHARAAASRAEAGALKKNRRTMVFAERQDVDCCGSPEMIVSTPHQWLLFKPRGGGLLAWEDRSSGFDRLAVMRCHFEEGGNPPSRLCSVAPFEDLLLPTGITLENLLEHPDLLVAGSQDTEFDLDVRHEMESLDVQMNSVLNVPGADGAGLLQVRKLFAVPVNEKGLKFTVNLKNVGDRKLDAAYAFRVPFSVEPRSPNDSISLSFPEVGLEEIEANVRGEVCGIQSLTIEGVSELECSIAADHPMTVWYHPLYTQLLVEGTIRDILQGTALFFVFQFRLEPDEQLTLQFGFSDGPGPGHG